MLRLVFLSCITLWYSNDVVEAKSENAFLYSLKQVTQTLDVKETPCITACPATAQMEQKFNDEVSISGNSLFLRDFYQISEFPNDVQLDVCDRPFKPVVVYNKKRNKYNIGYELYYYDKSGVKLSSVYEHYYDQYRSVNMSSYDTITHSSKPQNNFFLKIVDGSDTKFNLSDGSGTLVFHWISVFVVDYSKYRKKVELTFNAHVDDDLQHDLESTCDSFNLGEEDMKGFFAEKNQETSLQNIRVSIKKPVIPITTPTTPIVPDLLQQEDVSLLSETLSPLENTLNDILGSPEGFLPAENPVPLSNTSTGGTLVSTKTSLPENSTKDEIVTTETPSTPSTPPPISCGQVYGCFEQSQVVPLWYFRSRATRLASCMRMNTIPVWKTIADGQLRKVDRYIAEILHTWREDLRFGNERKFGDITYGAWNWLKLPSKSDPNKLQPVHLSDPEKNQTIPVPRIIYRIVSVWWRGVAIIIHNDRSFIPQIDRFCTNQSSVKGWEKITNEDWTTGLTYTCSLTPELDHKLGGGVFRPESFRNQLKGVPEQSEALRKDYQAIYVKPNYIQ